MNISRRSLFRALAGAIVGRAAQRALPASNVHIVQPEVFWGRGITARHTAALLKALWPHTVINAIVYEENLMARLVKECADQKK